MSSDQGSASHFSAFTLGKIRWWFNILDVDKDATISEGDFHLIAKTYIKEYQLDEVDTVGLRFKLVSGWGTQELEEEVRRHIPLIAKMADDLRTGLNITQDDFIAAFEQLIEHNSELARSTLENVMSAFFDVFDYNHDNYITKKEFAVAMRCFGLDDPQGVCSSHAMFRLGRPRSRGHRIYVHGRRQRWQTEQA